jgi:hypothetical protein
MSASVQALQDIRPKPECHLESVDGGCYPTIYMITHDLSSLSHDVIEE